MSDGIPKIIWQTYKTNYEDLPKKAKQCSDTWRNLNPDYEYRYMNDEDIYDFVENVYGLKMLNLMKSFKVPVMRIDLWRVLVTYHFGGVYSDIDASCTEPLDSWIIDGGEKAMNKNFIAAIENGMHYTQWAFMSKPKSPILKSIIDVIMERCANIDYEMNEFVHYHTGPFAFTEGIRRYFNLPNLEHDCPGMKRVLNCLCGLLQNESLTYENNEKMQREKFFCFWGNEWDEFRDGKIVHEFGSWFWRNDGDYQSWMLNPLIDKQGRLDR